jgi:hypothetical protein
MKPIPSYWLLFATVASILSVGIPYWLLPYNRLSLPSSLLAPGLAVVFASALLLRLFGVASFWRAAFIIGGAVGLAVVFRVLADGARDPTSHNLWPIEIVIALAIGLGCSFAGAIIGSLTARLLPSRPGKQQS